MEGIFKSLLDKNIPYAVVASTVSFKGNEFSKKEYFIIAAKKHRKEIKHLGFADRRNHHQVIELDLSDTEVKLFKDLLSENKFVKKIHTKSGRVYEINGISFKES